MPSRLAGLDLNLLLVLDALLREHSATRAAEALGVTQSAVSRSLSRLRDHLDDPLFVRQAHGLIPTARAQAIAAPLRQALEQLGSIVEPPEAFDPSTSRRRFRISSADLAGGVIVPRLAARLMATPRGSTWWWWPRGTRCSTICRRASSTSRSGCFPPRPPPFGAKRCSTTILRAWCGPITPWWATRCR